MGWVIVVVPLVGFVVWWTLKSRNIHIWILDYLKGFIRRRRKSLQASCHIYVCVADHYEPYFGNVTREEAHALVERWVTEYRRVGANHFDSEGRHPQHSYFYPVEEYDEWVLDQLAEICAEDFGDVDIHLHHDDDTAENLASTLNQFKTLLHQRHGLLRTDRNGEIVYGFIHGNWALDNSRPDGKWCGVNNELEVLIETGCVYDMTLPSAPSDTQTSIVNSIYFARDDGKSKSHDKGWLAEVGKWGDESELLMIQGPLTFNWGSRKFGIMPRLETGELSSDLPPRKERIALWKNCAITIKGAENHIFIKLYTHGLQKKNLDMLFGENGLDDMYTWFEAEFKNSDNYCLHYVTAWEMYKKIETICKQGGRSGCEQKQQ